MRKQSLSSRQNAKHPMKLAKETVRMLSAGDLAQVVTGRASCTTGMTQETDVPPGG